MLGLNWNMMIRKRKIFRECFADFDFRQVAAFGEADIQRILETPGMIRSRRKIEAVIHNAKRFQEIREEFGSFSEYLWNYTKKEKPFSTWGTKRESCRHGTACQTGSA